MNTEPVTSALAISAASDHTASLAEAEIATQENAREGKARGKAKKVARTPDVFDGLHPDEIARLEEVGAAMVALDRGDTKDAFERGRMLGVVFDILPKDETFKAWVHQNLPFTDRTARSYRTIVTELWEYEERAEAAAVPPTVLMELAREAVTAVQIEDVLQRFESRRKMTVSEVKKLLAGDDAAKQSEAVDPADLGGANGLARLATLSLRSDLAALRGEIFTITQVIEEALAETPVGRTVRKSAFMDAVYRHARLAASLLGRAVFSRMEDPAVVGRMVERRPAPSRSWMQAHAMLERLGNKEAYPAACDVRAWLEGEVLPMFEWMTAKGVRPPLTARAETAAEVVASAEVDTDVAVVDVAGSPSATIKTPASVEPAEMIGVASADVADAAPIKVAASTTKRTAKPATSKSAKAKAAKAKPTEELRTWTTASGETRVATRALTAGELATEKLVNGALNMMMR